MLPPHLHLYQKIKIRLKIQRKTLEFGMNIKENQLNELVGRTGGLEHMG